MQVSGGEVWVRVGGSRFLQTDPVKGGSANSYDYVYQDPINKFDLGGTCWGGGNWCHPLEHAASSVWHVGRAVRNAPFTAIGVGYSYARGGSCSFAREFTFNCQGVHGANNYGGFTLGNTWLHARKNNQYDPQDLHRRMRHERRHSDQYGIFGGFGFLGLYGVDRAIHRNPCHSWFERWAGTGDGGYSC